MGFENAAGFRRRILYVSQRDTFFSRKSFFECKSRGEFVEWNSERARLVFGETGFQASTFSGAGSQPGQQGWLKKRWHFAGGIGVAGRFGCHGKKTSMDQRMEFAALVRPNFRELCWEYGITAKTGINGVCDLSSAGCWSGRFCRRSGWRRGRMRRTSEAGLRESFGGLIPVFSLRFFQELPDKFPGAGGQRLWDDNAAAWWPPPCAAIHSRR